MATWDEFAAAARDLATIGHDRLEDRVAFLATLDETGAPRVHPVSPLFVAGRVVVRMYPSSPKVEDLDRDPRYAMHALVDNHEGEGGEFSMRGTATRVTDPLLLEATHHGRVGSGNYVVFEFNVEDALAVSYAGDRTVATRWPKDG